VLGWSLGNYWWSSNTNGINLPYFYTLFLVLRVFSSPNFRLGGTISAYKIVPDEIEEIKVWYGTFHLYKGLPSWWEVDKELLFLYKYYWEFGYVRTYPNGESSSNLICYLQCISEKNI
jgi:hypothetical protein